MKRWSLLVILWAVLFLVSSSSAIAQEAPSWEPPSIDDATERLSGLSFDAFTEEASNIILLYSPSTIISFGLAIRLGVRNDRLTLGGLASDEMRDALSAVMSDQLREYDKGGLTFDQRISYEVIWEIVNTPREEESSLFWPSVNPTQGCSLVELERFFAEVLPRNDLDDLANYISLLWQVEDMVDIWVDQISQSTAAGIYLPKAIATLMRDELAEYQDDLIPQRNPYYVFGMRMLSDGYDLPDSYKQDHRVLLKDAVEHSVIPAFQRLYEIVDAAIADSPSEMNWATHPAWPVYYRDRLRNVFGAELSPEAIHELAKTELERITAELVALAGEANEPDQTVFTLISNLWEANCSAATPDDDQVLVGTYTLYESARELADSLFAWQPETELEIVFGDWPNPSYDPPPFDESEPAVFLLPNDFTYQAYMIPTTVFHETIPGHYLQIETARHEEIPLIQQVRAWLGYTEGWAEYAQQLSSEQGWLDDNPCGYLGYLEGQLMMGAMTIVETGLSALGWSLGEAADYLAPMSRLQSKELEPILEEVFYNPTQATKYFVGRMMFLEQRQRAADELADRFHLVDFHQAVLEHGNVPLRLLEMIVDEYILGKLTESSAP